MWIFYGPHYGNVPYYKVFKQIPRKFALKKEEYACFWLDFYPIFFFFFIFFYKFDTVLGGFMGSGGRGVVVTLLIPMELWNGF